MLRRWDRAKRKGRENRYPCWDRCGTPVTLRRGIRYVACAKHDPCSREVEYDRGNRYLGEFGCFRHQRRKRFPRNLWIDRQRRHRNENRFRRYGPEIPSGPHARYSLTLGCPTTATTGPTRRQYQPQVPIRRYDRNASPRQGRHNRHSRSRRHNRNAPNSAYFTRSCFVATRCENEFRTPGASLPRWADRQNPPRLEEWGAPSHHRGLGTPTRHRHPR